MEGQKIELVVFPTALAQWHTLVSEAQMHCGIQLEEVLESYLVFLLMRFVDKPQLMEGMRAIELMEAWQATGQAHYDQLREVGDKCLLQVGLFPKISTYKHLRSDYFINLGQMAYHSLSVICKEASARLFQALADEFRTLVAVLNVIYIHRD